MARKLLTLLGALLTVVVLTAQTTTVTQPAGGLKIMDTVHNFGSIAQGRPVTTVFTLQNTGDKPFSLEEVVASCGCTTPEWSRDPIAPGGKTTIRVGYNAAVEGPFSKVVTVYYDGQKQRTLVISGNVYKAPATPAPLNASISLLTQTNQK